MTELIVLGAILVLIFAASLSVSAFFFGADWCPTCHTGMVWLQHLMQHVGVLLGAGVILFLDYYQRRYAVARGLAAIGAVSLVFVQLSWGSAFGIEQWLSGPGNDAAAVALEFGGDLPSRNAASARGKALDARQTTQLLLQGHVDQAVESFHRRARQEEAPVNIDLPVRAVGLSADELLLVDRSQAHIFAEDGRLLYRGPNAGASAGLLATYAGDATPAGLSYQTIELPGNLYRKSVATTVRLQMDFTLTLVKVRAAHKIAALDGELRSADTGLCATRLGRDTVNVHCKAIGQVPFCFSATLYAPDGRHNPEVVNCDPDYRRHWPGLIDVLSYYGVDLPVRDPQGVVDYPVGAHELETSYVLLKIYGELDHFKRTLAVAGFQPERWRADTR